MKFLAACAIVCIVGSAGTQVTYQSTPAPAVTAENEPWYVAREPITYAGNVYYPGGAQVHFNANEMVQSGYFHSIPLYTRTTIEPYSKVFVPLTGGLMQPYERRRTGELAGTVGSTAPAFPVVRSSEPDAAAPVQAPAAPSIVRIVVPAPPPATIAGAAPPEAVGTAGRESAVESASPPPVVGPRAELGLFVRFKGYRWFTSGSPVPLDRARMKRIGEHQGFPVYADPRDPGSIYVPVARNASEFVARYSRQLPR